VKADSRLLLLAQQKRLHTNSIIPWNKEQKNNPAAMKLPASPGLIADFKGTMKIRFRLLKRSFLQGFSVVLSSILCTTNILLRIFFNQAFNLSCMQFKK